MSMEHALYGLAARDIKKQPRNTAYNQDLFRSEIAAIKNDSNFFKEAEQFSNMSIDELVKLPSASVHDNRVLILDMSNRHLRSALNGYEVLGIVQDHFNKNIAANTSGASDYFIKRNTVLTFAFRTIVS
ncbi:UNVERIFIED_CONTAM: hypothetical protein HDU68_008713 [Siphonaria sp. JEL0065]|nr:hypothetical protein HDU68_008713 [Siphonaria sp. JEL0065]